MPEAFDDAYLDQMFRDHIGGCPIPGWHTRLMRLLRDQMQDEIDKHKPGKDADHAFAANDAYGPDADQA